MSGTPLPPLVGQLRFARSEFARAIDGVGDEDARIRLLPMNAIGWIVGHLAWQEQRYFVTLAQGLTPDPGIATAYAYGAPASTPGLDEVGTAWRAITAAADPWLDALTVADLLDHPLRDGRPIQRTIGDLLQRTIYHYWFHAGEILAVRQLLGHRDLPEFVGNLDQEAPYRPEDPA